jgi:hypothetical protein
MQCLYKVENDSKINEEKKGQNTCNVSRKWRARKDVCNAVYLEGHDASNGLAVGSKHLIELACLFQSPGESIQNETILALLALDSILDDADDDVVRHKPMPCIHMHVSHCTRHSQRKNVFACFCHGSIITASTYKERHPLLQQWQFWDDFSTPIHMKGLRFTRRSPLQPWLAFQPLCLQQRQRGACLLSRAGEYQACPQFLGRACLCLVMHDGNKFLGTHVSRKR